MEDGKGKQSSEYNYGSLMVYILSCPRTVTLPSKWDTKKPNGSKPLK